MIVLDTNVLSETMAAAPDPAVVAWLNAQALETVYLTAITVAELRYGAALMPPGRKRRRIEDLTASYVDDLFADRILAFDLSATLLFAERAAAARRQGRELPGFADAAIAAIALSRGFQVASRDTGPFEAMGASVTNPWTVPIEGH
ncbi:MAG: PIN domain-containing protein [Rhodobacteraceae bacterium]|nr:PIN domain-containing protein [Paracoccaceae bacterium]MBL4559001.1 PIN domain-containing protein [Paracoccaceae bacterium]